MIEGSSKRRKVTCHFCSGTGKYPLYWGGRVQKCKLCKGTGKLLAATKDDLKGLLGDAWGALHLLRDGVYLAKITPERRLDIIRRLWDVKYGLAGIEQELLDPEHKDLPPLWCGTPMMSELGKLQQEVEKAKSPPEEK